MGNIRVFLAYSLQVEATEALKKALDHVKGQLEERGYEIYDWSERHHVRNVGVEIEAQLRKSDLLILENSAARENLAFEVGFARCLDLPVIILKHQGSEPLPEDFGAPKYLSYPSDADKEPQFKRFADDLRRLLESLESGSLSPGHRALRSARNEFGASVQQVIDHHPDDHTHLHLMNGWVRALAADLRLGGPSLVVADSDYYQHMFSAMRQRQSVEVRAIADLTDDTESFWRSEHPEAMGAVLGERVFLIDWRLFFERDNELERLLSAWQEQLARNPDYRIYVAAKEDVAHLADYHVGKDPVGLHLLLVDPGHSFGFYRRQQQVDHARRDFVMEQDQYRFTRAREFYDAVQERAIPVTAESDLLSIKRAWLTKHRIGHWGANWTHATERRPNSYFDRYDQHIRCWIPNYNDLITKCASTVAREILRIRQGTGKPVSLLEVGHGTGSLTEGIVPWLNQLNAPFDSLGDVPPIDIYYAIDRAEQMRVIARSKLGSAVGSWVRLLRQVAWAEVSSTIRYDIIFGSLVMHFMVDRSQPATIDGFFTECAQRLRPGGSLVFADAFSLESPDSTREAVELWKDAMVRNGLSEEHAQGFLTGNPDMQGAPTVDELRNGAQAHGLVPDKARPLETRIFQVVVFHKPMEAAGSTAGS